MSNKRIQRLLVMTLAALWLSGCGSGQVKGEAPFVQVSNWSIDGTDLSMAVRIRNVNDDELAMSGLRFTVLLDETELVSYEGEHVVDVAANGFETLALDMTASDAGTALLKQLQAGDLKSLPYDFSGAVLADGNRAYRFQRDGHIYTVPGRPGQFR